MSILASEIGYKPSESKTVPMFFVVSVKKYIVMSFFTLGCYAFYWNYRNWAAYRQATGEKVSPLLRSICPLLFLYPLLARIDRQIKSRRLRYEWSTVMLMSGLVLIALLSICLGLAPPVLIEEPVGQLSAELYELFEEILLNPLKMLLVSVLLLGVQLWLMGTIQRAINIVEGDPLGVSNSSFTLANWAWMAIGILYWALTIVATMMALFLGWGVSQG